MLVDYHNHTVLCHHATGTMEEYLERAQALGIREYGFAEHSYWMIRASERQLAPTEGEMQSYTDSMQRLKQVYDGAGGGMILRMGIEADWVPARLDEARRYIASQPFDYVLGSVHHLTDSSGKYRLVWNFDGDDIEDLYERYFAEVATMVRSGFCDIVSHIDCVRRNRREPPGGAIAYARRIIPDLVASGVAIEINTSGMHHPVQDMFPSRELLGELVDAGVPVTLGADCHRPEHVGRFIPEALARLKAAGGREVSRFAGRKCIPTEI